MSAAADVEAASLQVLRSLQIPRPQYEEASAALTDGVDDVIRLYKQLAAKPDEPAASAGGLRMAQYWMGFVELFELLDFVFA